MIALTRREIDGLKLVLGVYIYRSLEGKEDEQGLITIDKKIYEQGLELTRDQRIRDDLDMALVKLTSFTQSGALKQSFRNPSEQASNGAWGTEIKLEKFCSFFIPCLDHIHKRKTEIYDLTDNDQRVKETLLGLIQCGDERQVDFTKIFMVNNASKIRFISNWFKSALESLIRDESEEVKVDAVLDMKVMNFVDDTVNDLKAIDREIRVKGISKELLRKRKQFEDAVFRLAETNPQARSLILEKASKILYSRNEDFISQVGASIGQITEDQEIAMISEGKGLISAGAGSGKTKVLAGKVVYHALEQGIPLDKIIACAFNVEASNELRNRIKKFGAKANVEVDGSPSVDFSQVDGMPNFRTTHSFSQRVMKEGIFPNITTRNLLTDYEDMSLIESAIHQVSLGNRYNFDISPLEQYETTGKFQEIEVQEFIDWSKAQSSVRKAPTDEKETKVKAEEFVRKAVQKMLFFFYAQKDEPNLKTQEKIRKTVTEDNDVLKGVATWDWHHPDKEHQEIFVIPYDQWTQYEIDSLNHYISNAGVRAMKVLQETNLPKNYKFDKKADGLYSNRFVQSAGRSRNQWFNMGFEDYSRAGARTSKGALKDDRLRLSMKDIKEYISKKVGENIHPTEDYTDLTSRIERGDFLQRSAEDLEDCLGFCAIYGAYKWLKGELKPMRFTHDDSLLLACKSLVESPASLRKLQNQFSHILVDEAQDLNKTQHLLYGLIAGQLDPSTGEPWEDGRDMNAQVFTFIGDDKQGIYEFRGAVPKLFVEKSDLMGGEFKTHVLSTNFRSGRNIVQAANNLIAHNTDQIPMVCNANPSRDEGVITFEEGNLRGGDLQAKAVDEIEEIIRTEGFSDDHYKIGIACRTNKELPVFALNLLKKGIPYYSKRPLLKEGAISSYYHMLGANSVNVGSSTDALLNLWKSLKQTNLKMPFQLNNVFKDNLERLLKQEKVSNPIEWFIDGGWSKIYKDKWRNTKNCKPYRDVLVKLRDFQGTPSELLEYVFSGAVIDMRSDIEENDKMQEDAMADENDIKLAMSEVQSIVYEIASDYDDIDECLTFLKKCVEVDGDAETRKKNRTRHDVVFLGTSHSWKGLEADHFFLPMSLSTFPSRRAVMEGKINEERRLAYVALTRGRDTVRVLTNTAVYNSEGRQVDGPSQFIDEACIKSRPYEAIKEIGEDGYMSKKSFDLFMRAGLSTENYLAFKHLLK